MNRNLEFSEKQILAGPASVFAKLRPDADRNEVVKLEKLCQQRQSLIKNRKEVQLQANIISREIGKAKQDGKPIQSFMSSMQEKSTHLKTLDEDLKRAESQILDFFDSGKEDKKPLPLTASFDSRRVYPSHRADTHTISISLLDHQESEWNAYVDKNQAASLYHRVEWKDVIQKTYGHKCFYYVARDIGQNIVGILPLTRLSSHLFGDFLVSMPYFMRGGAIADHPSIENMLMQQANHHAASQGIDHIEYRDDILRGEIPVRLDKVNMVLTLPDTCKELWMGYTSKLRAQIKRSKRENPKILFGGKEYLDNFYIVYERNMRDLGSPAHSKEFVRNILDSFMNSSWIIVICLSNKPVAAGLLISHGDTLSIPLASTIRNVNPFSINMLMYSEMIKFSVRSGFRYFSFGRSSRDSGTFLFKQQWGAEPKRLYWHYWMNGNAELPSLNPDSPRYTLAIKVWKRLPLIITRYLGPSIVKYLP